MLPIALLARIFIIIAINFVLFVIFFSSFGLYIFSRLDSNALLF